MLTPERFNFNLYFSLTTPSDVLVEILTTLFASSSGPHRKIDLQDEKSLIRATLPNICEEVTGTNTCTSPCIIPAPGFLIAEKELTKTQTGPIQHGKQQEH